MLRRSASTPFTSARVVTSTPRFRLLSYGNTHQFVLIKSSLLQVTGTHTAAWLLPGLCLSDWCVGGTSHSITLQVGWRGPRAFAQPCHGDVRGDIPPCEGMLVHELCPGTGLWHEPCTPALRAASLGTAGLSRLRWTSLGALGSHPWSGISWAI